MAQDRMDDLLGVLKDMLSAANLVESIDDVSDKQIRQYYTQLQSIYAEGFRHRYSEISSFLESNSPDVYSSLDIWLSAIISHGEREDPDANTTKIIIKLLDHIRLEMIRIDRMKAVAQYANESHNINQKTHDTFQDVVKAAKDVEEKVGHFQEQSIAILSIFSAVILAFMGGLSFASGIMSSIAQTSMFRLVITILLLGFVLFNSIFILMRFVAYIVYKKDSDRFKNGIKWFNGALLIIFAVLVGVYCLGGGKYIEQWGNLSEQVNVESQVAEEM